MVFRVFVNGEEYELMEDKRLALYHKFPEGTKLYDASHVPPRLIPLSLDPQEYGVTCKLMPFGHYLAFLSSTTDAGNGKIIISEPLPANSKENKYLIVHNLPSNTTPEQLGKFFEQFDYVQEADVMKWSNQCKGRGFVHLCNQESTDFVLQNHRVMQYYDSVIWVEGSDLLPKVLVHLPILPPPIYGGGNNNNNSYQQQTSHNGVLVPTTNKVPPPVMMMNGVVMDSRNSRGFQQHSPSSMLQQQPPPPLCVSSYFVTQIYEEHIQTSVRDGIFWPTKVNQRSFYQAFERGPVNLIFIIVQRPALFGYARLTPRDMVKNKHANFTLEWVKHGVYMTLEDLGTILPSTKILDIEDGSPLKAEIGLFLCDTIDQFPERPMPHDLPYVHPITPSAGRRIPPQSGGFHNVNSNGQGGMVQQQRGGGGGGGHQFFSQ